jgi:hypothetical protein
MENEMNADLLAPAAVLIAWTLFMLVWLAATRFPAMKVAGIDMAKPPPGGRRGQDLEGVLPDSVNWKAHNYAHLVEQPTLFYAVLAIIALLEAATATDVYLAWAYVGLRIAHSLVHATVNVVPVRFLIFLVSSGVLVALSVRALIATLG